MKAVTGELMTYVRISW